MLTPAVTMHSASRPPLTAPKGTKIVGLYMGGDTPHVWTQDEVKRFGKYRKLPIYVRSNPTGRNPVDDAMTVLQWLYHFRVPRGQVVALDLEGAVNKPYVSGFGNVLRFFGYKVWPYGEISTIFGNPPEDGYWVAHYDNKRRMVHHPNVRAKQYKTGPSWTTSMVKYWQYVHSFKRW